MISGPLKLFPVEKMYVRCASRTHCCHAARRNTTAATRRRQRNNIIYLNAGRAIVRFAMQNDETL